MELQEAIEHAREVTTRKNVCASCREEHGQLADWLEELNSIREILGDCDLERLKELVGLVKNIPHVCKFCVGCEMEPKDGHGCDEYDSFVFSTRRLQELADADLDRRCLVLPCKQDDILWTFCNYPKEKVYSFKVSDISVLNGRIMFNTDILSVVDARDIGKTIFLTREDAEEAAKCER